MQSWSHPFFLCVILTKYRFLHSFRFCKDDNENLSEHKSREVDLSDLNVDPAKWRLSIDKPRCSSKCVLLHNENEHWRVRISDSATMKEKSVAMKTILALIRYNDHNSITCVDPKLVTFNKYPCHPTRGALPSR